MSVEDVVPISQGRLRMFMYENYAKGGADRSERIVAELVKRFMDLDKNANPAGYQVSLADVISVVMVDAGIIEETK